ncbi:hypothetical protein [Polaribacter sp. R77954]|uniref:hypothetical protein n=1 Tax=Polaribacter sp. R77954 TaxID=3093870 RepID=UPI0037C60288
MKTLKKRLVLVAVVMLGTLANYANDKVVHNNLNAKKVKVVFKGTKKGQQLTIKDQQGTILYSEDVKTEGELSKVFDFSKLNNGSYTLELEKDFQIIVKSLKIEGNKVTFDENAKKVIFKPVVRSIDNKVLISKITFDEKPLDVALYFNNEIIYSETLKGNTILNRVYKLDEEIKGEYKVVIRNNGRSFTNKFEI